MVLADTAGTPCARISSLDVTTAAHTIRRSSRASVLCSRTEPGLQMRECSKHYCWKQRLTTDTFCPRWSAIRRYVHPASRRSSMRPRSNGRIATVDARCLEQSIAGWHSAPLSFHVRIHDFTATRGGYTVYWCDCLGTSHCDIRVSFGLHLLSYSLLLQR